MGIDPNLARQIERQFPMFDRSMVQFAGKADRDLLPADVRDRKTDCIPVPAPGKMRTSRCVTKVAEFPYVGVSRRQFLPRGAAVSRPSRSEWQARRMRPGAVIHHFKRHKKRASQPGPSEKTHCNAGRDMNGKQLFGS
jgi:hypothetical protein